MSMSSGGRAIFSSRALAQPLCHAVTHYYCLWHGAQNKTEGQESVAT